MTTPEADHRHNAPPEPVGFWRMLVRALFSSPGRRTGDHVNQKAAWVLIVGFAFQGCHECGNYLDARDDRQEREADLLEQRANYKELVKGINNQAEATRQLAGRVTTALEAIQRFQEQPPQPVEPSKRNK